MTEDHMHEQDIYIAADGSSEYRDSWVVVHDEVLHERHSGGVCVHAPSNFEIGARGQHSGSLRLQPGSYALILGTHSGSLHVGSGAVAEVVGSQSGSVHVDDGGLVRVQPRGKLAGSLHVSGLIENRGTRGGSVHLSGGEIRDLGGSSVKEPVVSSDGRKYYSQ